MGSAKRFLVAEDNEILRNGMRTILESAGYSVVEAENGFDANEELKRANFDLIVSDVEMPEMDGLRLLELVRARGDGRFLMISELNSALQSRQARQLGADQFINKPFSRSDFMQAVESALTSSDEDTLSSLATDFVQVPVSDFITGTRLKVDVYVRLSAAKFLKIGHKGGEFHADRVQKYVNKGIQWFFMRKEDFAFYVGFNINLAQAAHSVKALECSKKIRLTMHVTQTLISQLKQSGLKRDQLADATNVVNNAVELIALNPSTLKLLESIEVCGSLPSHSIAVAIWSCLIARQLNWAGQSTYFKIAVSALFHDVGQKEMDDGMVEKPRFEMTKQERKFFESHALRGRDILQSVAGMPEDAATVALQHHEHVNGTGYPYALKIHQIHPLARLVAVADRFCELIKTGGKTETLNFEKTFDVLMENAADFDPAFLTALKQVIQISDAPQAEGPSKF